MTPRAPTPVGVRFDREEGPHAASAAGGAGGGNGDVEDRLLGSRVPARDVSPFLEELSHKTGRDAIQGTGV